MKPISQIWLDFHTTPLSFYGFITIDFRQYLFVNGTLADFPGYNDLTYSLLLAVLVALGSVSFYFTAKYTKGVLISAIVIAIIKWLNIQDPMNIIPVFWTSLIMLYFYAKPFVDSYFENKLRIVANRNESQ